MFDWLAESMTPYIGAVSPRIHSPNLLLVCTTCEVCVRHSSSGTPICQCGSRRSKNSTLTPTTPSSPQELGDLLEITLNNSVEVALAIFLLVKNRYRLLQTTIVGVSVLHLLLIPGVAFMSGGARLIEQHLHAGATEVRSACSGASVGLCLRRTQLNHSLLTLGVMTLILPAVFFAALNRGTLADLTHFAIRLNAETPLESHGTEATSTGEEHAARVLARLVRRAEGEFLDSRGNRFHSNAAAGGHEDPQEFIKNRFEFAPLLSDQRRGQFLEFSHGLAILLLLV